MYMVDLSIAMRRTKASYPWVTGKAFTVGQAQNWQSLPSLVQV